MPEPTDDELLAVWKIVEPRYMPSVDTLRTMRRASCATTTEDVLESLRALGPDAARLADELCRRFPQPITDAVLGECGFASGPVPERRILRLKRGVAVSRCVPSGAVVWWGEVWGTFDGDAGIHREHVRDARRLRELVAGLELVYGRREG